MTEARANYAIGKLGKVVPIGLFPETDLIDGLCEVCSESGIHHGVVLTVVGSLNKLTLAQIISDEKKAKLGRGYGYMEHRIVPGPIQIGSVQGVIWERESGEVALHLHGTFNDAEGQVYSGHLVQGENPVRTRLEAIIAEISDVRLVERYNESKGYVFSPEPF